MKRRAIALLGAAMLILACAGSAGAGDYVSESNNLMKRYGGELPAETLAILAEQSQPESHDLGDVTVTFLEAFTDGLYAYTSARVVPNDPAAVLILPGSGDMEDRVSGNYGEGERDDDRTFAKASQEDGKRLLTVSVEPDGFRELPTEYFVDSFQRDDDVTVLLAGSKIPDGSTLDDTYWQVLIREIDPQSGEEVLGSRKIELLPMRLVELGETQRVTYRTGDENALFGEMLVIQTPIATYVEADWKSQSDYNTYECELLDADGKPYGGGAGMDSMIYRIPELPERMTAQWVDRGKNRDTREAEFYAVDNE